MSVTCWCYMMSVSGLIKHDIQDYNYMYFYFLHRVKNMLHGVQILHHAPCFPLSSWDSLISNQESMTFVLTYMTVTMVTPNIIHQATRLSANIHVGMRSRQGSGESFMVSNFLTSWRKSSSLSKIPPFADFLLVEFPS